MVHEYIAEGNTVEEAIEKGCKSLNVDSFDAQTEILELPKKGFFGKVKTPARVKVWYDDGVAEKKPAPRKKPAKKPKPENKPTEKKAAKPAAPKPAPVKTEPAERPAEPEKPRNVGDRDRKTEIAQAYLKEVLAAMGLTDVQIQADKKEDGVLFSLEGENLGVIIGRRGETLDALQYLTSLVCNRIDAGYYRVTIDCGDFRVKREETLKALAEKIAKTVLRTGRSTTLEPMNPYERRIIHAVIAETEGVVSKSVGEEPYRRVVVSAPGAKSGRGGKSGGGHGRRDAGRGGRPRGGKRPPAPTVDPDREKLVDTPDASLYGKIEL